MTAKLSDFSYNLSESLNSSLRIYVTIDVATAFEISIFSMKKSFIPVLLIKFFC